MSDLSNKKSTHNTGPEPQEEVFDDFVSIWEPLIASGRSWLVGEHKECELWGEEGSLFAVRFPLSCMIEDLFCPLCKEPAKHEWVLRFPLTIEELMSDFPLIFIGSPWAICGHDLCNKAPDGRLAFLARLPTYEKTDEINLYCPLCRKTARSVSVFAIDSEAQDG